MLGRNVGYLNSRPDFRQVETKDVQIAVLVLGQVETMDI